MKVRESEMLSWWQGRLTNQEVRPRTGEDCISVQNDVNRTRKYKGVLQKSFCASSVACRC